MRWWRVEVQWVWNDLMPRGRIYSLLKKKKTSLKVITDTQADRQKKSAYVAGRWCECNDFEWCLTMCEVQISLSSLSRSSSSDTVSSVLRSKNATAWLWHPVKYSWEVLTRSVCFYGEAKARKSCKTVPVKFNNVWWHLWQMWIKF